MSLPFVFEPNWGVPHGTTLPTRYARQGQRQDQLPVHNLLNDDDAAEPHYGIWFNHRRLLEPIGNIPPAEAEERYYAMLDETAMAA
ncbi:hypothetical protein [Brucella sp. NBRC 14130]|uniref:hypothetical protein n=1 Tax=Brucella sp. NBRC 14130 TaxID=3075483 RepID=UPI003341316B